MNKCIKKVSIFLLIVTLCAVSFAQKINRCSQQPKTLLPSWMYIASTFTTTDIHGNTVNLQAILDSGKAVVLEYSFANYNRSWNLHNSGILDALAAQPGIEVIWIEEDPDNTLNAIYGIGPDSVTCGNWTQDAYGNNVTYTIIDDDDYLTCYDVCPDFISMFNPNVMYIAPSGYYCKLYDEPWGFTTFTPVNEAVSNVLNLARLAPTHGVPPMVRINGAATAIAGSEVSFYAEYTSYDPVRNITWEFSNGRSITTSGATGTVVWDSAGSERVICTVTNAFGSTSDTLNVNVIEVTWDSVMTYAMSDEWEGSYGDCEGYTIWGVRFPANMLAGRNYLENVQIFSREQGYFQMSVYQPAKGLHPSLESKRYSYSYPVYDANDYITLPIYENVEIDSTKDLWITFSAPGIAFPACETTYCGDTNSSLVYEDGRWMPLHRSMVGTAYSWLIKAKTAHEMPALNIHMDTPPSAFCGELVSFNIDGPANAEYEWEFEDALNSHTNGRQAVASWVLPGQFRVSVTATRGNDTVKASITIDVINCGTRNLPYRCDFEAQDSMQCWTLVDNDEDGLGWMQTETSFSDNLAYSGTGAYASASYFSGMPLIPDNWMISPKIYIPAEGATLHYYVAAYDPHYYDEYYSVQVSTSGTALDDFAYIIYEGMLTGPDYRHMSFDFSEFAGKDIHIAFRHHNCSAMHWLLLDNVSVTPGQSNGISNAHESYIQVYPNPTCATLNIAQDNVTNITLTDANGRIVLQAENTNSVSLEALPKGIYFARVTTPEGVGIQKVIKK